MNLHYEFWVKYYDALYTKSDISTDNINTRNKSIIESRWDNADGKEIPFQDTSFCMKVGYPGLLVGLGSLHQSNHAQKESPELILGFSLDPVYGLPVIPGSQLKGMLRAPFIQNPDYIAELLGWNCEEKSSLIPKLENEIFGAKHPEDPRESIAMEEHGGRDVFLDVYPVKTSYNQRLFGIEIITPHRLSENRKYDGLSKINPIHLLKVLPGVVFQFRFRLTETVLSESVTLSVNDKLKLFSDIIKDMGAGAKTNVGFGTMISCTSEDNASVYKYLQRKEGNSSAPSAQQPSGAHDASRSSAVQQPKPDKTVTEITDASKIKKGMWLKATLIKDGNKLAAMLIPKTKVKGSLTLGLSTAFDYKEKDVVIVEVTDVSGSGNNRSYKVNIIKKT